MGVVYPAEPSGVSPPKKDKNDHDKGISGPLALAGDGAYDGPAAVFVPKKKSLHVSVHEQDGPYGIQKPSQVHDRHMGGPRSPISPVHSRGRIGPRIAIADNGHVGRGGIRSRTADAGAGASGSEYQKTGDEKINDTDARDNSYNSTRHHQSPDMAPTSPRQDPNRSFEAHGGYRIQPGNQELPIGSDPRRTPEAKEDSSHHGELTTADLDYYLGKADVDPRRDMRGQDLPKTETHTSSSSNSRDNIPPTHKRAPSESREGMIQRQESPRSSFSSDSESAYLTPEQARKAHQKKMVSSPETPSSNNSRGQVGQGQSQHHGHDHSHGLDAMINQLSCTQGNNHQTSNNKPQYDEPLLSPRSLRSPEDIKYAPEHASIAISDSTMSMMPSLPPINSPLALNPRNHMFDSTAAHRQNNHNKSMAAPFSPTQQQQQQQHRNDNINNSNHHQQHDDPYAETAYSDDFSDSRSLMSSGYPPHHEQPYNSPYAPPRNNNGYMNNGYDNNSVGPNRGPYGSPPPPHQHYNTNYNNNTNYMNKTGYQPPYNGDYRGGDYGGNYYQGDYQGDYHNGYQGGYQGGVYSNGPYPGGGGGGGGHGRPQGPIRNNSPAGGYGPSPPGARPVQQRRQAPPF
ncbi:hypothetical protein BGZ94_000355 [Podila epigama]|nr:hypothetical protein BGZ94_000355 [Podila epigama]